MNNTYFSLLQPELREMVFKRFEGVYWVMRADLFGAQHQLYSVRAEKGACQCPHCEYLSDTCDKLVKQTTEHGETVPQLQVFLCIK